MYKIYVIVIGLFFILSTISAHSKTQTLSDFKGNPDKFVLNQNYPNPFNPVTVLSYTLKTEGYVKLSVFNLVGQEVEILVDQYQIPGQYEYSFDASSLPAGIYLYKLQMGDNSSVKRMTLVK